MQEYTADQAWLGNFDYKSANSSAVSIPDKVPTSLRLFICTDYPGKIIIVLAENATQALFSVDTRMYALSGKHFNGSLVDLSKHGCIIT